MNKAEYVSLLKDPKWQKKRLEILERDHFACQICFDGESELHVHHKSYRYGAMPWDYDNNLLVTLCKNCHAEETANLKNEERALLDTLKIGGANSQELNALMDAFADMRRHPLTEPEWTMIVGHIRELFSGRESHSGMWEEVDRKFWIETHIKAAA